MIYWPLYCLVEARIKDIMIVTGGQWAGAFLQLLGNGRDLGLHDIHYTYQEGEGGIADALSLAEHFVDGERCVIILGDNIVEKSIRPHVDAFRRQESGGRIVVTEVPNPEAFGVVEFAPDGSIANIEEKPRQPKSNHVVTGIYMYDEYVWEVIKTLKPSSRGELEITDVNNAYLRAGKLQHSYMDGWWTDAGTFDTLRRASNLVAEREAVQPFANFMDENSTKDFT